MFQRLRTENRLLRQRIDNLEKVGENEHTYIVLLHLHDTLILFYLHDTSDRYLRCCDERKENVKNVLILTLWRRVAQYSVDDCSVRDVTVYLIHSSINVT